MTILGPCPCQGCRMPVWWDGKSWVDGTVQFAPLHICQNVDEPVASEPLMSMDTPPTGETMAA